MLKNNIYLRLSQKPTGKRKNNLAKVGHIMILCKQEVEVAVVPLRPVLDNKNNR